MKKSLSLLLTLALVFGLFASMANAADAPALTTAEKYKAFVDAGILKGTPDGDPHLSDKLMRSEFATIAVAVAGLPAATSGQSFSDVKKGQWYYGAIEAAAKAGYVNGSGAGKFSPNANVTVESIIKVAVIIAGLDKLPSFKASATVAGSSSWAGPYIQAALDAGLISARSDYTVDATRGDTIDVAYAVSQAKAVPQLSDVKATLNADDTITVTGKVTGKADAVKVTLGTADAVAATLNADKTFTYTTAAQAAGDVNISVVAYDGTKASAASTAKVTIDGFTVKSVTVVNDAQIAVTFNKALQEGVAAGGHNNTGYYLLAGNAPAAVALSNDKTTVTLTFKGGFVSMKDSFAQFEVSNSLKSASGKSLTAYKGSIQLSDSTAPTVTGVTYSGKSATITFSEPVDLSNATVSLNGTAYTSYTTSVNAAASTTVPTVKNYVDSITVPNLTAGTNYSLYIINFTDLFGNANDYNSTLNVADDVTAPTVVSVTVTNATVNVKYSEAILSTAAGTITNVANNATLAATSVDGDTVSYDLSSWLGTLNFLTLSVKVNGAQDLFANPQVSAYTTNVTISQDKTAPTFVNTIYTNDKIVFVFSEPVKNAPSTVSYSFTSAGGVRTNGLTLNRFVPSGVTAPAAGYDMNNDGTVSSDEAKYVAYTAVGLAAGTYTFTLLATNFEDLAGNPFAGASPVFKVNSGSSSAAAVNLTGVAQNPLNNNELVFTFSKNLTNAAFNPNNYKIGSSVLPADTTFYFDGVGTKLVAVLPAGAIPVSGIRTITVVTATAEDGGALGTATGNASLTENVVPVAGTVTVVSDQSITVSFSEALNPANVPTSADVSVYIDGSTTAVTLDATTPFSINGSTLTIKAPAGTFTSSQAIKVTFAGTKITDSVGNLVKAGSVTK